MILAGDIGGTKARLALYEADGAGLRALAEQTFPSRSYGNLREIVQEFCAAQDEDVERACFGVAGPVRTGTSRISNLPWLVDAKALAEVLQIENVELINDVEASAYGLADLGPADFAVLNEGAPDAEGNAAVISAGTGLGQAGLRFDGRRRRAFASEGGHADFAPRDELQIELLRYLLARFEHVSWERVISGPGLLNIYNFLRDAGRGDSPGWLREELRCGDPARVITRAGLEGSCRVCEQALDLLVSLYGAEAGNLGLKVMATAGVFLGGGIAPRIVERLKTGRFMEAFTAKGRMRPLLAAMPVRVILDEQLALRGAAVYASSLAAVSAARERPQ